MKFCPYVMVGYPSYDQCLSIVECLVNNGANMIELGLPFSDPAADGPTLTEVNVQMTNQHNEMDYYLSIIEKIRQTHPGLELMVMTYLNPIYRYGFSDFCQKLDNLKINHLLVVDLPLTEFKEYYPTDLQFLQFVFIVSQNCNMQYLKDVTEQTFGSLLYIMTTLGTTGTTKNYDFDIIKQLKTMKQKTLIAGFGIKTSSDIVQVNQSGCDGYIIGSELVRQYQQGGINGLNKYLADLKLT